ncbi:MAG: SH3 domain-containing protein [Candidatus Sabulitectum sp.]|nr:SH3 domain-containing protein [Candidatus Sabulitectum sp.]
MKSLTVVLAIFIILSGCGTELSTGESTPEPIPNPLPSPFQPVVVTGRIVNLRQGPGTQYAVVGSAHAGDSLMVTGEAAEWYRIYVPEKSLFAWIYAGLTSGTAMPR